MKVKLKCNNITIREVIEFETPQHFFIWGLVIQGDKIIYQHKPILKSGLKPNHNPKPTPTRDGNWIIFMIPLSTFRNQVWMKLDEINPVNIQFLEKSILLD